MEIWQIVGKEGDLVLGAWKGVGGEVVKKGVNYG